MKKVKGQVKLKSETENSGGIKNFLPYPEDYSHSYYSYIRIVFALKCKGLKRNKAY